MHASGSDETVQALMLGGDVCYGRIKSDGILDVYLAVMDGAAELVNPLFGLEELCRWFRKSVNAVY